MDQNNRTSGPHSLDPDEDDGGNTEIFGQKMNAIFSSLAPPPPAPPPDDDIARLLDDAVPVSSHPSLLPPPVDPSPLPPPDSAGPLVRPAAPLPVAAGPSSRLSWRLPALGVLLLAVAAIGWLLRPR